MKRSLSAVLVLAAATAAADAPKAKPSPAPATAAAPSGPIQVDAGVYVNSIHGVNLREGEFKADFYVWFRWRGTGIEPLKSFQIMGGTADSKDGELTKDIGDVHYATCHVVATLRKHFDVRRFPLDDQTLTISIEDNESEADKLRYVADTRNSALDPKVEVPGWAIAGASALTSESHYNSNYGDISVPTGNQSAYSRLSFKVDLQRPGRSLFFKLAWTQYLAVLIAFLAFFIKPTNVDPRFGLPVGAIFALVASQYVITASLPDSSSMTLTDQINGVNVTFVFLSLIESTVALGLFEAGREDAARRLDRSAAVVAIAAYVLANAVMLLRA